MAKSYEMYKIQSFQKMVEVISECDYAFLKPIMERNDVETLLNKIWNRGIVVAAKENDETIGYIAFYSNDTTTAEAYITLLAIKPEFQKMGYGKGLFKKCVDMSSGYGMKKIRLEVNKNNLSAINFYYHIGFTYEKDCSPDSMYFVYKITDI